MKAAVTCLSFYSVNIPEGCDLKTPCFKGCKFYISYFLSAVAIIQEVPLYSLNEDDQLTYHEMFMLSEQQYNRMLFYNKQHYILSVSSQVGIVR